jgi:hypothetical protein
MDLVRPWTWSGRGLGQAVDLVRPWTMRRDTGCTGQIKDQRDTRARWIKDSEHERQRGSTCQTLLNAKFSLNQSRNMEDTVTFYRELHTEGRGSACKTSMPQHIQR